MAWHGLEAADAFAAFGRDHRLARLSVLEDGAAVTLWEPEPATVTLGGVAVALPGTAFLQATAEGEAALVHAVTEAIGDARPVADLFAGLGTFTMPLARSGRVRAVEAARDAVLALDAAARRAGAPVEAEHRDLYRRPLVASELSIFDAVVLDPPRAGGAGAGG